eukprot:3719771-Rhodomonas_salina.2
MPVPDIAQHSRRPIAERPPYPLHLARAGRKGAVSDAPGSSIAPGQYRTWHRKRVGQYSRRFYRVALFR